MYDFIPPLAENVGNIETLLDKAFGSDRHSKTSYRFRQGGGPMSELGMVAWHRRNLVGTISYWPICIGADRKRALLLGPLAVEPSLRGHGIGVTLIRRTLAKARQQQHKVVLLVGDSEYYDRFGFVAASEHHIWMDGQPDRLMVRGLVPGALDNLSGQVLPWREVRRANQAA
jgi:predicted N-acetyltransferase YhbS